MGQLLEVEGVVCKGTGLQRPLKELSSLENYGSHIFKHCLNRGCQIFAKRCADDFEEIISYGRLLPVRDENTHTFNL
jgi:hypothetical protein